MEDPLFREEVRARWLTLRASVWSDASLAGIADEFFVGLMESGAVQRNDDAWDDGIGMDAEAAVEELKAFLLARAAWLDAETASF